MTNYLIPNKEIELKTYWMYQWKRWTWFRNFTNYFPEIFTGWKKSSCSFRLYLPQYCAHPTLVYSWRGHLSNASYVRGTKLNPRRVGTNAASQFRWVCFPQVTPIVWQIAGRFICPSPNLQLISPLGYVIEIAPPFSADCTVRWWIWFHSGVNLTTSFNNSAEGEKKNEVGKRTLYVRYAAFPR